MRNRLRALLITLVGLVAATVVVAPAADATGGCRPYIDRATYDISIVC